MAIKLWKVIKVAFITIVALHVLPATAQQPVDATKLKKLKSNWARSFSNAWKADILADASFNCSDRSKPSKYYLVFHDEKFNQEYKRVAGAVWKSTLAFEYESGTLYCGGGQRKFHVVGMYDDEVVLDMTFAKGDSAMFASKSAAETFFSKVRQNFRPVKD